MFWAGTLLLLASCSADPNSRKLKYLHEGSAYYDRGKYQEAVIEFRNALDIDGRSAEAHHQLARAYLAVKNLDSAYREMNEAATLQPANSEIQLDLAALLLQRKEIDQARSVAQKVTAAQPANARAHAVLAETDTLHRDYANAVMQLRKAVELQPSLVENYDALGAAYRAAGQFAEAEKAYRGGVGAAPKSAAAHQALSEFYFSIGRLSDAETEMRTASKLDARSVASQLFLARIYLTENNSAAALDVYTNLKKIAPSDPQAYRALGAFYVSTGQKEKAAAEFETTSKDHPKDNATRADWAESLIALNRTADAISVTKEILRRDAGNPRGLYLQGRLLAMERQYPQAVEMLQRAIKAAPDSADAYYALAMAQQSAGYPDIARTSFTRALELNPTMAPAAAALARLAAMDGDYDDAAKLADKVRKSHPNLSSANLASASARIATGDLRGAESILEEALKNDPVSLPLLASLLNVHVREGRGPEAVQEMEGLVKQYPENAGIRVLLALAYFNLSNLAAAEENIRESLKLDPSVPDAHTLLASIHLAKGDAEGAKADLLAAIAAHPRNLLGYMTLVTQYEKEGNWQEAIKLCERAHAIEPGSPMVSDELAFLYLEHGGDINMAVSLAQGAKQKMPDSPVTADALGWAYYKLGSYAPAVEQLQLSCQKMPNNPIYHYHLGIAYVAARQIGAAQQSLRVALRIDPHFPYASNAQATLDRLSKGAR